MKKQTEPAGLENTWHGRNPEIPFPSWIMASHNKNTDRNSPRDRNAQRKAVLRARRI